MAGVIVLGLRDDRAAWARLYIEPVEQAGEGIDAAVRDMTAAPCRGGGRELIRTFQPILGERGDRLELGSGDDAAVVRASDRAVVSTDAVVEGVSFDLAPYSYGGVGPQALATALSDLAAMGVGPSEAYVAIGIAEASAEQ